MLFTQINSPFLFNIGNKTKQNPFIYRGKEFHLFLSQNQRFLEIRHLVQPGVAAPQKTLEGWRITIGFPRQDPAAANRGR